MSTRKQSKTDRVLYEFPITALGWSDSQAFDAMGMSPWHIQGLAQQYVELPTAALGWSVGKAFNATGNVMYQEYWLRLIARTYVRTFSSGHCHSASSTSLRHEVLEQC